MSGKIVDRPKRTDDTFINPGEPHVALTLVLDVSGSMDGKSIDTLNAAVNGMIDQMKADHRLKGIIDLAIFIFGTHGREPIYQGFRAIQDCEPVDLKATDVNSYVVSALESAVNLLDKRCKVYDRASGSYKPWLVLITDGEFHDDIAELSKIGNTMKQKEQKGRLRFFALGVDGYKKSQIEMLTNNPSNILDAKVANFIEFFSWVGKSMKVVSSKAVDDDDITLPVFHFEVLS